MYRYSDEIIEEVRSRNDIVDVVRDYVSLKKAGANYQGLCPFHNEKSPSFSVSPGKQMFHCFGCGKGGNVITFVRDIENISFIDATKKLAERAGVKLPEVEVSKEEKERQNFVNRLLEVNKLSAQYFYRALMSDKGQNALNYFKKRGLTEETIKHFGLGFSNIYSDDLYKFLKANGYKDEFLVQTGLVTINEKGAFDKFWNRAMFPIMDEKNRVIAFGGRVMGDAKPKYLNSPETRVFDKSNNLYALNYAVKAQKDYFLLCEGYMDVISLHQAGFTNAVASLGTALTDRHAAKIKKYVDKVYLTYDSDAAGQKAIMRAIPILENRGIRCKVVNMNPYKDPDEFIKALGAEEYQKRIDNAEGSFFYEVDVIRSQYNMEDPVEKSNFQRKIAERLLEIKGELERNNFAEAFVSRYNLSYKSFEKLLIEVAERTGPRNRGDAFEDSVREREAAPEYKSKEERRVDEEVLKPQRNLLTQIVDEPKLYEKLKGVLEPSDFSEGVYRKAAELVFSSIENTGTVNPASLVSLFGEDDDDGKAGGILQAELPGELDEKGRVKALEQLVDKVKMISLSEKRKAAEEAGDNELMAKLMTEIMNMKMKNKKQGA